MESQIKSSFIPQDTVTPVKRRIVVGNGGDLLVLVATILMVASAALAGSVFLYNKYLENSIASKQQSIQRAQAAIEPALIKELSKLDSRLNASDLLLGAHISVASVFSVLEQVTLQSIELTDFSMVTEAPDSIKLTLKGLARSVNAIALQSDLYSRSGVITSPIFSDINRTNDGLTQFRVDAELNASALRYRTLLSAAAGQQNAAQEQQIQQQIQQQEAAAQSTTTPGDTGGTQGGLPRGDTGQ